MIIGSQIAGGFWGMCLAWLGLYNEKGVDVAWTQVPDHEVVRLQPAYGVTLLDAFVIEAVCTFMFVMTVLMLKTARTTPSKNGILGCATVAATLMAMFEVSGAKTGGAINPSVGFNMTIWNYLNSPAVTDTPYWTYFFLYTLGPWLGGLTAGFLHNQHVKYYTIFCSGPRVSKLVGDVLKKKLGNKLQQLIKAELAKKAAADAQAKIEADAQAKVEPKDDDGFKQA